MVRIRVRVGIGVGVGVIMLVRELGVREEIIVRVGARGHSTLLINIRIKHDQNSTLTFPDTFRHKNALFMFLC